ncbi:MAG: hypothetical protein RJA36_2386 [Pseudomonadota bacterium]|jgi:two-component system sensor histidine kinase PilS (NtrC family)
MRERHDGTPSPFMPFWPDLGARRARPWSYLPLGPDADRLWVQLMRARVTVAAVLLLLQILLQQHNGGLGTATTLCLAYLCGTFATLPMRRPAHGDSPWSARWLSTLWTDIACFALLRLLAGSAFDFAPLFLLPVLLASTLGPLALALASAAAASLVLLGGATLSLWNEPGQAPARFMQSGLTGTGFFLLALLTHQLAQRLARELALVRDSQAMARLQGEVNGLIARGLSEGVLVFDEHGRVWHANPPALSMLGLAHDPAAADFGAAGSCPAGRLLLDWGRQGLLEQVEREQELEIPAVDGDAPRRKLQLRLRLSPSADDGSPRAGVLFMEDMRSIEARLRTERLAAMGRVSAAVAHEIRNPLAAISQANALLAEDGLAPEQQHLSAMIERNAQRLARTVDDILELARAQPGPAPAGITPLDTLVRDWVQDWRAAQAVASPRLRLGSATARVRFEPEHLRRVLVNLLDNARKHGVTGAIEVWTEADDSATLLGVWSTGPELSAAVRQHLFEPFFSSDSRSSGLGLYISRELCQRNAAEISYRRLPRSGVAGNAFLVHMTAAVA